MNINKIIVSVDGSPLSIATMDQVAIMANRAKVNIDFLFIEDINLKRLINLNHIKMISPFSSSNHIFKEKEMDEMFKSQKLRLKKAIAYAMQNKSVNYEFLNSVGVVENEIITHAKKANILALAWAGWRTTNYYFSIPYVQGKSFQNFPNLNKIGLSPRIKEIIKKKITNVLVVAGIIPKNSSILTYFDGTDTAKSGLDFVIRNVVKLIGNADVPLENNGKNLPINIVCEPKDIDNLKDFLKNYNQGANIIKTKNLSLSNMKIHIDESRAKVLALPYDLDIAKNFDKTFDIIEKNPISFMFVKL